eukprot:scaffold28.g7542.t1
MVKEHSSLSNFEAAAIKHCDLDWDVDFATQQIRGTATHRVTALADGVSELVLDTHDLSVSGVEVNGTAVEPAWRPPHPSLGTALVVPLPAGLKAGDACTVAIRYSTAPSATATQWLPPEQTAGKQHPYLFTQASPGARSSACESVHTSSLPRCLQCQAIHARSILPCLDTPGSKFSYNATVRVPAALTALMSAVSVEEGGQAGGSVAGPEDTRVFRFCQAQPISSYLLALAVGQLESRELGPISRAWSEPSMVDAGAYEFAETPQFLAAAESVAGPYAWGRYDLLLLPPSFPFGGMENPTLTFVTPTLLAGDRSLTNVVAHEIAHSWTGNLVTNKTWESFWLNEGWTVWLERKILGRLYGEKVSQFQAAQGLVRLGKTVREQWGEAHPFTRLVPNLSGGEDPDDAFSAIPYEKGFYFLHYLSTLVGNEQFEAFFRAYVQRFEAEPLTAEDFKAFFLEHFRGVPAVQGIDWDAWYYGTGMPPDVNKYDESLAQAAYDLAVRWHTSDVMGSGGSGPPGAGLADIEDWSSTQLVAFLDKLGELRSMQPLHPSITRRMAELYGLDQSNNSEVRCSWYLVCVRAGDDSVLPRVAEFLREQGRMKFLRPIYKALHRSKSEAARATALSTFEAQRASYHPIAAKMAAADLQLAG